MQPRIPPRMSEESRISSLPRGPHGRAASFHFDVPGGKWQTVMCSPVSAASRPSSRLQRRLREPLDRRQLSARAVEFVQPPSERPYRLEAVLGDNPGNSLVLVEPRQYSGEDVVEGLTGATVRTRSGRSGPRPRPGRPAPFPSSSHVPVAADRRGYSSSRARAAATMSAVVTDKACSRPISNGMAGTSGMARRRTGASRS